MFREIERVTALDAEEFAVDSGTVAIVAANDLVVANAQRGTASVRAVRADGADVIHFPGARPIAISSAGERADGANVDACAALVAFEMISEVRNDGRNDATIGNAEGVHSHPFIANSNATVAKDASRGVKIYHRRPLFLVHVDFAFDEAALARAVTERHVLQFALAALIAYRAIQRMIGQQEFQGSLTGILDELRFGVNHHALAHGKRAAHLKLGRLLHLHQAHAAGGLKRQAFVIAECRNFDTGLAGCFNQKRAFFNFDNFTVDRQLY